MRFNKNRVRNLHFVGQIGNYASRVDPFELRFNYLSDRGSSYANRYKFQLILPYVNVVSSGAGGAAGCGKR